MKTTFYFRTREQYKQVVDLIDEMNQKHEKTPDKWSPDLLTVYTRYINSDTWIAKIPKKQPGNKRYIGIVSANKHKINRSGINIERVLASLGVEVVYDKKAKAKDSDEKTTYKTHIKTYDEFRTITSIFNKRFGHGKWRIQGPKGLQSILKRISDVDNHNVFIFDDSRAELIQKYPGGVPVTLITNEPDANIARLLFKVVLKG